MESAHRTRRTHLFGRMRISAPRASFSVKSHCRLYILRCAHEEDEIRSILGDDW